MRTFTIIVGVVFLKWMDCEFADYNLIPMGVIIGISIASVVCLAQDAAEILR